MTQASEQVIKQIQFLQTSIPTLPLEEQRQVVQILRKAPGANIARPSPSDPTFHPEEMIEISVQMDRTTLRQAMSYVYSSVYKRRCVATQPISFASHDKRDASVRTDDAVEDRSAEDLRKRKVPVTASTSHTISLSTALKLSPTASPLEPGSQPNVTMMEKETSKNVRKQPSITKEQREAQRREVERREAEQLQQLQTQQNIEKLKSMEQVKQTAEQRHSALDEGNDGTLWSW